MNIKGIATLQYLYPDGRLEPVGPPMSNDITWANFRHFFIHTGEMSLPTKRDAASLLNGNSAKWQIFYGANDSKQSPLGGWYWADGTVNVQQDFPTYTDGALATDPDRFRLSAVIQAPIGAPRTIRCLGVNIINNGGVSAVTDFTSAYLTLLRLSTPCIQATNVAIVVTYDIYLYPALAISDHKLNSQLYTYLKTLLKRAANAVNSTNIRYGTYASRIQTSAYNLANLNSFSIAASTSDNPGHDHELTDHGGLVVTPARTFFGNAIRYVSSYGVNDFPVNGTFIKKTLLAGRGINSATQSEYNGAFTYTDPRPVNDTNPVQNVYPQRNNPVGPSNDLTVANVATMTGGLTFNISQWKDPNLQRLFRVRMTGTGAVGVATYQISKMDFIAGFVGNRWQGRTALMPQSFRTDGFFHKETNNKPYESWIKAGGTTYRSPDNDRLVLAADCTRTMAGVNVYNVVTGERTSLDSTVGLNVTAVSDGETTDQFYFVTCANTGLWRVSLDFTTVEHITSPTGIDKAFQICRKNDVNQTIWVLFDGGLCKLSNPNAAAGSLTWTVHNPSTGTPTFTFAGLTDAWQNVTAMIIDPDNASDRFLFVISPLPSADTTGYFRRGYVWWDTMTGVATHPSTNGIHLSNLNSAANWSATNLLRLSDSIRCQNGIWVANASSSGSFYSQTTIFNYASANLTALTFADVSSKRPVPSIINGVSGFMLSGNSTDNQTASFVKNSTMSTIPNDTTLSSASPYVDFMFRSGPSSYSANLETASVVAGNITTPLIYLPNSNFIFTYEDNVQGYGVTPFMLPPTHLNYNVYKGAFWKDYGWDGVNWVLNHAGSKTTSGTNETTAILDDLGILFTDGVSGTSFVANEFFTFVVGNGLFKDNGVNVYTSNLWISMDACKPVTQVGTVPLSALGLLTDEPVTFSPSNPSRSSTGVWDGVHTTYMQNKGAIYSVPKTSGNDSLLVSDQLIPASTAFDFRFKWHNVNVTSEGTLPEIGLATGNGTYTSSIRFRLNRANGTLGIYNNTTLLATIPSPSIEHECRIVRDGSNNVISYYNGVQQHAPVLITSRFVILANSDAGWTGAGWWDMKLTYTENRRVVRIGDLGTSTGSFNAKFSGLTTTPAAQDTRVLIGSGSPLTASLDYTASGVDLVATGQVKVATGAGWLIFHNNEPANPIDITTVCHFILNTQ
mgnify:CR=1 FL=1